MLPFSWFCCHAQPSIRGDNQSCFQTVLSCCFTLSLKHHIKTVYIIQRHNVLLLGVFCSFPLFPQIIAQPNCGTILFFCALWCSLLPLYYFNITKSISAGFCGMYTPSAEYILSRIHRFSSVYLKRYFVFVELPVKHSLKQQVGTFDAYWCWWWDKCMQNEVIIIVFLIKEQGHQSV